MIDFGTFSAKIANQIRVFSIGSSAQSRINGVYMLGYYIGGAIGSMVGLKAFTLYQRLGVITVSLIFLINSACFNVFPKRT